MQWTEQQLLDAARRGERAAQRAIYERTSDRIHGLLLRMTRNRDDAAELTQETYLRVFTRIGQFDGRARLETWIYRVAVNEALQFLRRPGRRLRLTGTERLGPSRAGETGAAPADGEQADRLAARIDIDEALESLSDDDRVILLLRYQEGLDYAAIADVTECPPGTVASRLSRARDRLRARLQKGYGGVEETGPAGHPRSEETCRAGEGPRSRGPR